MSSSEMNEELQTGVDEMDREHALELQIVRAIQAALASGDSSSLAPTVRRYVKTVSDISALFDRRKDTLLGLA